MAFSKTPMQDTYQTKPISFLQSWETRSPDNAKDVDNLNIVWDVIQGSDGTQQIAIKRNGLEAFTATFPSALPARGAYYLENTGIYVIVDGTTLYQYTSTGAFTASFPCAVGGTGTVRMTEFLYENGQNVLVILSNAAGFIWNAVTATQITDPDFPPLPLAYPVVLDGYLFVMDVTGNIWNSDNNDPFSWSSSNLITAESYSDIGTALARNGQYIVAFGVSSIQFFYDAANPTGTPLAMQSTVLRIGSIGGIAQAGDSTYFIGQPYNGSPGLYELSNLRATEIVSFPMTRRLSDWTVGNDSNIFVPNAFILNINGHSIYVWKYHNLTNPQTNTTVYGVDLDTKLPVRLAFKGTTTFNINTAVTLRSTNALRTVITFWNDTKSYAFSPTAYQDDGVNFMAQVITTNEDFSTRREKFGSRMLMNCDQTPSTSNMSVSWSDDDYQSFSTPRTIDLSSNYPVLWALGKFKKRAFKFNYSDNFPMRWEQAELDYNQGNS